MQNGEQILEKISGLEEKLQPIIDANSRMQELKADLTPLGNRAMSIVINELLEVEAGFDLDDLFDMLKQLMRSTKNITYVMKQLDNILEFWKDMEPLMHSAVPQLINHLDELEKRGVFRMLKATLDIRAKMATVYDPDDVEQIGDGMVVLLGLAKKLADPKAADFINRVLEVPGNIDLDNVKPVGVGGLMSAGFNKDIKNGLGVMMELTKALGKIKKEE
jgi:uncharacterized protein YjgD (DUF1641 family)